MDFGKNLRVQMAIKGWNQVKLATESGLSQSYISKLCSNKAEPATKTVKLLAFALEVDPSELDPSFNDQEEEEEAA